MIKKIDNKFLHVIDGLQYSWVHKAEEIQKKFDLAPDECVNKINEIITDFDMENVDNGEIDNAELDALWDTHFKET